ncbi:MAG: fumarylacetoacetate hydrolase family protein [Chloroflexi bacterium]|nr:fumarylacetoacetate hydrolase family protein [Chloroflexota bacterium]
MKLALFQSLPGAADTAVRPGVLTGDGIVDVSEAVARFDARTPQEVMVAIIEHYDLLRPELERLSSSGRRLPLAAVRLRPPLPRPGKILCCIGNYWEHAEREPRPLNMFLKNPDAVIGPGDTIVLPEFTEPYVFQHEAELAIVIKGPAKQVSQADYRRAVFGYTCIIDVSARAQGRQTWRSGSWMGKSFDTFAPLGPCIATADEIADPNNLHVQFWNNGDLRHDYNTNDMEHRVPELIEFASAIMTLNSGDVIACGTNHEGLGPLQDGELAEIEIQGIGRMALKVADPLKRTWERGIYMGPGSTNPAARAAPQT